MSHTNNITKIVAVIAIVSALCGGVALAAAPVAAPAGSTFDQRLAQRKAEQNITLSAADTSRLVSTCVTAQGKIRLAENDVVPKAAIITKTYQRVDARIWAVTGQLKLANQDTFKLEKDRLDLAAKASNYQTLSSNYQQTLDDLTVINCKADPAGFKALLETARAYLTQIRTQTTDIRSYVVDTIKPELANQVANLQQKTPNNGGN